MYGLTIHQPWAWSIIHGKPVENRTWQRAHRGRLAIHAGKGWDTDGQDSALVRLAWRGAGHVRRALSPHHPHLTFGAIIAVAEVVDICGAAITDPAPIACGCGPWAARGQYHWRLANVRALAEPVPCRGFQQLWTLPDEVEAAVVTQLGERVSSRG